MSKFERFTGPRARLVAGGTAALFVAAACTPAQRAAVEGAFPCAPGPVTGTADGDTAVTENPNQITISGDFFDDKKTAIICFPTGEQAIARPTSSILKNKVDKKITFETVDETIDTFYSEHPEAEDYEIDGFKYPKKVRDRVLGQCKDGLPDDPNPEQRKLSRLVNCSFMVSDFYAYGTKYNNPEMIGLAQIVRDYAVNTIKGRGVKATFYKFLKAAGVK